jgi:RecA/RadA recombinase
MIYGRSDTGKSTMATELAAFAQKQGIIPIFIITENKFSDSRATQMGVDIDNALIFKGVETIEEGCLIIKQIFNWRDKNVRIQMQKMRNNT